MRAAIIERYGQPPVVGERPEPKGELVVDVVAGALNPVDVRIASGSFYAGSPELPYVPGGEAIVRLGDGTRHYATVSGAFAERVAVGRDALAPVPDGVDDGLALACGVPGITAWTALRKARLAPGERVLVLGVTGAVGTLAAQLARGLGAGEVVGAARAGGDVTLDAVADAGPFDVVIDPLWGAPAAAATAAMARGGRLVQIGQSAGAEATLTSADVRGRELELLGLALVLHSPAEKAAAYADVVARAAAGELTAAWEEVALADVARAWERQAGGSPGTKLVIRP